MCILMAHRIMHYFMASCPGVLQTWHFCPIPDCLCQEVKPCPPKIHPSDVEIPVGAHVPMSVSGFDPAVWIEGCCPYEQPYEYEETWNVLHEWESKNPTTMLDVTGRGLVLLLYPWKACI